MKRALEAALRSPVFANLLMVFLIVAGFGALSSITRELFPEFSFDTVTVTVPYPGAAPEEIERSVTIKIEEAVRGLKGVHKIESTSSEGICVARVEVDDDLQDPRDALIDIRNEVNQITTFPADAEDPVTKLLLNRREVLKLVLAGPLSEQTRTALARELEEEILLLPGVSEVNLTGVRDREIAVRVRERDLQRVGLSFDAVANALRSESLDLPVGTLRSPGEEMRLRVEEERERGLSLAELPLVTRPDGTRILVRDVAEVHDGFVEEQALCRVDQEPAVLFQVMRASDQDTIDAARAVKAWAKKRSKTLPQGVSFGLWKDDSRSVVDRLSLLGRNGAQGLALVFAILLVFLGMRLAFWVAFGLPVAFLTAIVLLVTVGGTLNMITSFALIMVLGILVDDSIVVAENIARHMQEDGYTLRAAIAGLSEVAWPVVASVTTTAVAFVPLFFLGGTIGKFVRIMPVAVIATLLASLIEALLILPAHLAHARPKARRKTKLERLRRAIDDRTDRFISNIYGRSLAWALQRRYLVLSLSAAAVILTVGLVASGRPAFTFFPRLDAEYLDATITLPRGASLARTRAVLARLERSAARLRRDLPLADDGGPIIRRVLTTAGTNGVEQGTVSLELAASNLRQIQAIEVIRRWRRLVGAVPEATSLVMSSGGHRPGGRPIEVRISARSPETSAGAATALREALATYPGVFGLQDNLAPGKRELRFRPRPEAGALGIRAADLARQLYAGVSGQEVARVQRGRDEIRIRVRYEPADRARQHQLRAARIRGPSGALVPLGSVATIERNRSLSRIERRDGRRVVTVFGDVDDGVTNAQNVVRSLEESVVPDLARRFPDAELTFGGAQEEEQETVVSMVRGFCVALFGIYVILALLFGSYLQPVIVMAVIPVGFAGAVWGHILVGKQLMIFSMFGMVGLAGIVVNDALVLIDFINRARTRGATAARAAQRAGESRFRPVFLTTATTVAGLLPLLLETSLQAQFLIPMALSIAAGVATATALTLYLVPSLYLIVEDVRAFYVGRAPARRVSRSAAEPVGDRAAAGAATR